LGERGRGGIKGETKLGRAGIGSRLFQRSCEGGSKLPRSIKREVQSVEGPRSKVGHWPAEYEGPVTKRGQWG